MAGSPLLAVVALLLAVAHVAQGSHPPSSPRTLGEGAPPLTHYQDVVDRILNYSLANSTSWEELAVLTDTFGSRFTGSQALEDAIQWILRRMREDGLENVKGEPAMVAHWTRGPEKLTMLRPRMADLQVLGVGATVPTPPGGITADVVVVGDMDELKGLPRQTVQGKIVLFDAPWTSYGETVLYRVSGAVEAAKCGAVASLYRSVTPFSTYQTHTGSAYYEDGVTKIPHAAVTVEDSAMLHRLYKRGVRITVHLTMNSTQGPDVTSHNVIAEWRGHEKPDEIVVLSGHIDSWDVGTGAMDDGGGAFVSWEALRVLKALGLRARRTIRVVMWTNEECGARGGKQYAVDHALEMPKHSLVVESDMGAFYPMGIGFTGSAAAKTIIQQVASLLGRVNATTVMDGAEGVDISVCCVNDKFKVPGASPLTNDRGRYFWYHHSRADTIDKLDPQEMRMVTGVMAALGFVVADLPDLLPR